MAVSWPSLVATMAVLTIAHAATQFGKPNQNTGFTRPPVTQAVYVNTIPEFIEARKFPEISCIRTFDMSGRRDQLLDTPLKRANFLSGLRGDKLTVFGQITGNPECDVSIYTPEHMHRALDYLVHEMDATERDIFFTAPLTLPTMNPGDIARAIQKWTPLIQLLKNRDFLIESNNVIPIDMFGVMCDNLLVNRSTLLETLLLNDRLPDCSSLLITERHVDNNTGVFPDVGRGKAFYAKLRQTTPDWDLYMLRFCPEALTPGDIDRIQSQNFFDPQQLDVISGERELFWRLPGKVKDRILDKLTQSYGPFLSWSPDLIEKMSHYVFMTAPGDILNLAPIQTFFEIEVPSDEELEETPEVKSFFRSVAWQAADYLNDPANLATFMSLNITVKSNVFCLLAKFAQVPSVIQLSFDMMDRLAGIQHC
ncbi:uncharacterized protein LOC101855374, partial [Aplysia californica]|uniref:Uncharacterized protein LOC101855374 n=1 Tax=Aplysia californica TaxID=6500 RepID=A0ABM1A9Y7_APLCA